MLLQYEVVLGYVLHGLEAGRLDESPNKHSLLAACPPQDGEGTILDPSSSVQQQYFPTSVVFDLPGG